MAALEQFESLVGPAKCGEDGISEQERLFVSCRRRTTAKREAQSERGGEESHARRCYRSSPTGEVMFQNATQSVVKGVAFGGVAASRSTRRP